MYSLRLEASDSNFPTGALGNFDSGNKLIDSLADITFLCKLNAQEFNRNFEKDHILYSIYVHAKSLQSYPHLCDPMECSLPGSSVHGILLARILESDALSPGLSSRPRNQTHVS